MKKKVIIGIVGIVVALALLAPSAPEGSSTKDVGVSSVKVQEVATTTSSVEVPKVPKEEVKVQKEEPREVCPTLKGALDYMNDFDSRLMETEGKDYMNSDEYRAFSKAFWSSFWEEHNDCPICEKNGYYE